jgi:acetylornithine deacetylase
VAVLRVLSRSKDASPPPNPPSLLFVVGEEKGGEGMKLFSDNLPTNFSAIVFGEPTEGKLASGHKGMMSFELSITGKAAHSGYPDLGLNANDILIEALTLLKELERTLPESKVLGKSTLNIGRIQGGVAANVVAAHAEAEMSIRIAAGSPDKVQALVDETLESLRKRTVANGGSFVLTYSHRAYGPVHIDTDLPGFDTIAVNYGTDIPNLESWGSKRYLYGPGSILVAHGADEHLTTKDMETAAAAYESIIRILLQRLSEGSSHVNVPAQD